VQEEGCCECNGSDSHSSSSTSCDGDFDPSSVPPDQHELDRQYIVCYKSGRYYGGVYLRWGLYQTEDEARTALETMKSLFPPSWWIDLASVEFVTTKGYIAVLRICNCRPQ
jgi:hypothetical protein